MSEWWEGLSMLLKTLYCIAFPSTLLLVLQTLLSMFGAHYGGLGDNPSDTSGLDLDSDLSGGHDLDIGHHGGIAHGHVDGGDPSDFASMQLFTLQTVVAFFTVFSWSSIVLVSSQVPNIVGVGAGLALGILTMFLVAKIVMLSRRLTENGTVNLSNAIGEYATVYIPCPPRDEGLGKVTMTVQGRLMELSAVSCGEETIKTGTRVRVVDLQGDTVVIEKE